MYAGQAMETACDSLPMRAARTGNQATDWSAPEMNSSDFRLDSVCWADIELKLTHGKWVKSKYCPKYIFLWIVSI